MNEQLAIEELASAFRALGDPTRLRILTFLASKAEQSAETGATVGEVCAQVTGMETITSTISHHLKELRIAGLIDVEKRGRFNICRLNRSAVDRLASALQGSITEQPATSKAS